MAKGRKRKNPSSFPSITIPTENDNDAKKSTTPPHTNSEEEKDPTSTSHSDIDDQFENNDDCDFAWVSNKPYHVDLSKRQAFYSNLFMIPPYKAYDVPYNQPPAAFASSQDGGASSSCWTVQVGDVVAVQVEPERSKRSRGGGRQKQHLLNRALNRHHPYTVSWWPGEVVSIHLNVKEQSEAVTLVDQMQLCVRQEEEEGHVHVHERHYGDIQLEIRWLYEISDIPGSILSSASNNYLSSSSNSLVEILETDLVDDVSVESLLGPVILHTSTRSTTTQGSLPMSTTTTMDNSDSNTSANALNMPLVQYACYRAWSVQRKTLLPIGRAENRIERGLLHSRYLREGTATRAAWDDLLARQHDADGTANEISTSSSLSSPNWRAVFRQAMKKLTLTEASAVGHFKDGRNMIGRTSEMATAERFIRTAVENVDLESPNEFTLFVAGPPGTGKTASIRAIVQTLRQEQAKGQLAPFEFHTLNGMEMRNPFDTYVRLWEAVSPRRLMATTAADAAYQLEVFFARKHESPDVEDSRPAKRKAIVVLMDEIDYLLTKKQTVLYNLFDWPIRGYEFKSEAQLILIGIANTMNLPDRLHESVKSRLSKEQLIYHAYNAQDGIKILSGRLGLGLEGSTSSIFHEDAIKFAARKMAANSGDIRKAFHLCTTAAEMVYAELDSGKRLVPANLDGIVSVPYIQRASREASSQIVLQAVMHSTPYEALLLVSLASLKKRGMRSIVSLEGLSTKMMSVAKALGDPQYLPSLSKDDLLGLLERMVEVCLIA